MISYAGKNQNQAEIVIISRRAAHMRQSGKEKEMLEWLIRGNEGQAGDAQVSG